MSMVWLGNSLADVRGQDQALLDEGEPPSGNWCPWSHTNEHTQTWEGHVTKKEKTGRTVRSQATPRTVSNDWKPGERMKPTLPEALQKAQPCPQLDFMCLASGIVREDICAVFSLPIDGKVLQKPQKTNADSYKLQFRSRRVMRLIDTKGSNVAALNTQVHSSQTCSSGS